MHLTDAEAAFRVHKTDLRIRPVWHQTAGRVQAHLLVCFLAYVLRKTLEGWMARAGLGNSPTTVLEELARIHMMISPAPRSNAPTTSPWSLGARRASEAASQAPGTVPIAQDRSTAAS